MNNNQNFIYIDNCLKDYNGHSATFAFSLLNTNYQIRVLAHKDCIFLRDQIKPVFSFSFGDKRVSLPETNDNFGFYILVIYKILYANILFLYDLIKLKKYWGLENHKNYNFIIANSESRNALAITFLAFLYRKHKFIFYFQRNAQKIFKPIGKIIKLLRIKNIYCIAETDIMAERWSSVLNLKCNTFPFPIETKLPLSNKIDNNKITFGILGPPREEKGFSLVLKLYQQLDRSIHSNLKFIIQIAPVWGICNVAKEVEEFKILAASNSNLYLLEHQLIHADYQEILSKIDILLLPYLYKAYSLRSSGVLIEGISNGKPIIVTQKTLLAEIAQQNKAAILEIQDQNVKSLKEAVEQSINEYHQLKNMAYDAALKWREKFNSSAFLKYISSL